MNWKTTLFLTFLLSPCFAAETSAPAVSALKTDEDKVLYSLGAVMGRNLSPLNLTAAEVKHVAAGMKDSALGGKLQVELNVYGPKIEAWAQARQGVKAEAEKKKGKAFAAKMAKEKGAVASPSGLIYIEEKAGTGPNPSSSDTVKVHYEGTLIDGTVFDSSYKRNEPTEFPLNRVIRCWTEGVAKMKAGGKAKLVCPSDIAYGDGGNGHIPGGATLVFTVELLSVQKK